MKDLGGGGGGLELFISGKVKDEYEIEYSTNLRDWSLLTTIETGEVGGGFYTDDSGAEDGGRFYRVRIGG
jgi:hypothetical protein